MTGDRSLEDFVNAGSPEVESRGDATEEDSGAGEGDVTDEAGEAPGEPANDDEKGDGELIVEPARATHDWAADGSDCAACGETVERRWRAGEETVAAEDVPVDDRTAMVCDDCKVW